MGNFRFLFDLSHSFKLLRWKTSFFIWPLLSWLPSFSFSFFLFSLSYQWYGPIACFIQYFIFTSGASSCCGLSPCLSHSVPKCSLGSCLNYSPLWGSSSPQSQQAQLRPQHKARSCWLSLGWARHPSIIDGSVCQGWSCSSVKSHVTGGTNHPRNLPKSFHTPWHPGTGCLRENFSISILKVRFPLHQDHTRFHKSHSVPIVFVNTINSIKQLK